MTSVVSVKFQRAAAQALGVAKLYLAPVGTRSGATAWKRIYHVHVPKTGGTSLNTMFFGLSGAAPDTMRARMDESPARIVRNGGLTFVGWNRLAINSGRYFYAFSHIPLEELSLRPETFTYTCLREPVERAISLYRHLFDLAQKQPDHPVLTRYQDWRNLSVREYFETVPPHLLQRQLHMFSRKLDVEEALQRLQRVDHVIFQNCFDQGVTELGRRLDLPLVARHTRKTEDQTPIPDDVMALIRQRLSDEVAFYERAQERQAK